MTKVSRMWDESDSRKHVAFYMEKLRRGDPEDVFFNLIESPGGGSIIPIMIEEFRRDPDPKVRTTIIEVISEFRQRSSVPFFVEALHDTRPLIWKAALDALVAIPCAESLAALESALTSAGDANVAVERTAWIREAIGQVREALKKSGETE